MKVTVNTTTPYDVTVNASPTFEVSNVGIQGPVGPTGPTGPVGPASLTVVSQASDVDSSNLNDGSVLVYKTTTSKWTSTTTLDAQIIEGGHF